MSTTACDVPVSALLQSMLLERLSTDVDLQGLLPFFGLGQPRTASPDEAELSRPRRDALDEDRAAAYSGLNAVGAELRRCHALLDRVGAAFGACRGCLGFERACAYCQGEGTPGSEPIDEASFWALVQPLLDQLGTTSPETMTTNTITSQNGAACDNA